jgi:hypothetical protein
MRNRVNRQLLSGKEAPALNFSAMVKRRMVFAPPAPEGAVPLLLCYNFFIHVNTSFIIGVSTPFQLSTSWRVGDVMKGFEN